MSPISIPDGDPDGDAPMPASTPSLLARLLRELDGTMGLGAVEAAVEALVEETRDVPSSRVALDGDARALAALPPDTAIVLARLFTNAFVARRRYPRAMAEDVTTLRRLVADRLADYYPHSHQDGARGDAEGLRVMMVLPHLLARETANLTQVALSYAEGLAGHPDIASLDMLVTNEFSVPEGTAAPATFRTDTAAESAAIDAHFERVGLPASRIHHAVPPVPGAGSGPGAGAGAGAGDDHVRDVAAAFAAVAPDIVFVPNVELAAAHVHGMGRTAATIFLQTSLRNRPSVDFDRYLYLGERRAVDDTHIHPARWDYHPFCYARFGFGGEEAMPWPDGARVVATVGNRLEREVTRDFADTVCAVLREHPDAHWALVGVRDVAALARALSGRREDVAARIHAIPFTAYLGDLLGRCAAYANPPRTGGAVSMSVAVHAGTPVLTYPGNDACTFVIPELIALDRPSYRMALSRLVGDRVEAERLAALQGGVFGRYHSPAGSAADLAAHFYTALRERRRSSERRRSAGHEHQTD